MSRPTSTSFTHIHSRPRPGRRDRVPMRRSQGIRTRRSRSDAQSALSQFYKQYQRLVRFLVSWKVPQRLQDLRDDVEADVWLRVVRAFERGVRPAHPTSWLRHVTHRAAVDVLCRENVRGLERVEYRDDSLTERREKSLLADELRRDRRYLVLAALHLALTPTQQVVIASVYFGGQSRREVGDHLGISGEWARVQHDLALERLRALFDQWGISAEMFLTDGTSRTVPRLHPNLADIEDGDEMFSWQLGSILRGVYDSSRETQRLWRYGSGPST
jgi:RNA polymerase sigma factor (sigma-70 family)